MIITYVDDFLIAVDEESADGLSALVGAVRLGTIGRRHVHTMRCSNRADLSSRSLGGFSLWCAQYGESLVLLDAPPARRKRDESITAGEMSTLRSLLGQLMWLETQVIPELQAPLSLLLGYVGVATVSTVLEANKFVRRALVWSQTPLRTHVHDSFCDVG